MNGSRPIENVARGSSRIARAVGPVLWPGEWSEAIARWVILGLAGSIAVTALSLHRWLMWIALAGGLLVAHQAGRSPDSAELDEPDDEAEPEAWHRDDVIELLWELTGDRNGIHLAPLRTELEAETRRPWTPAEVKALLADAGVRVRDGVRIRGVGNTTGVHRDDLPPRPARDFGWPPVGVVGAGQDANTNTNNSPGVEQQEGMSIIRDPDNDHRWRVVRHH